MDGGDPKKHYTVTDIDIYEHFLGKRLFLEKASALPGKSLSAYLHLDYVLRAKLHKNQTKSNFFGKA